MSSFKDAQPYRQIGPVDGFVDTTPEQLPPAGEIQSGSKCPDTLKVSKSENLHFANKEIWNWLEDCLDLVRVKNAAFQLRLWPLGERGVTIKGASENVWLTLDFSAYGRSCEVELGQFDNYWFPGRAPTQDVRIDVLTTPEPRPARIRLWDAKGVIVQGNAKVQRVPKAVWFPYFCFRYAVLRVQNAWSRWRSGAPVAKTK